MGRNPILIANNREKAAILAYELGFIKTWSEVYAIANNKPFEETIKEKHLSQMATKWKAYPRIQNAIDEIKGFAYAKDKQKEEAIKARAEGEKERGKEEGEEEKRGRERLKVGLIDYTNPENQRQKLNELVNNASNTAESLDALKVIIQGQKADREGAKEQKQVRAYLPLMCSECPLYEKAKKG